MPPLRIEVTGYSTVQCPAERAVVNISVRAEANSQEQVMNEVTTASSQIRSHLEGLAGKDDKGEALPSAAITHWSNSSLSTGSYTNYTDKGKVKDRTYDASMSFTAKFRDFSKLGSTTTALSTLKNVRIDNIQWALTEATQAKFKTQCRQAAVHDAVAKARDFAAALDRPAPPVVDIKEDGFSTESYNAYTTRNREGPYFSRMLSQRREAPEREDLNFQPEHVAISCTLGIKFVDT